MSRRSAVVSSTLTAARFSSRRSIFLVPGIGTIHGFWASSVICKAKEPCSRLRARRARQYQGEPRAFLGLACDDDVAAHPAREIAADRQAESGAFL